MNLENMLQEQENVEGIVLEEPEHIRVDLRGVFCPNCNSPSLFDTGFFHRMEEGELDEANKLVKCRLCWSQFTMGYVRNKRV